ncbi:MAG TPA: hypothetical protein VNG35_12770 [Gemmatimonadales bacterium]|nr:hypothetical protein [Gemmatimonadales bacterium]
MRNHRLLAMIAAAALLITAAAAAQVPGYGGGMGGSGAGGMGGYRRGVDPTRKLPSANQLEGPPIPDFFIDRFELDSAQGEKYRVLYDSFMDATAVIRDSAKAARSFIDGARETGDRLSARLYVPVLQTLGDSLTKADDRFDNHLKAFLSSGQVKSYKKWRDEERRREHADEKPEPTTSSDPNTQP